MPSDLYRVLFLSRRNSARSIAAQAILNKIGTGRFEAFSAGVEPAGAIDSLVLELLTAGDYPVNNLHPAHYNAFTGADAPQLDFVFTLSDTAAGEALPQWPGLPITAHWRCEDPTLTSGDVWERKAALARVISGLERRLGIFTSLPFASLDRMSLQNRVTGLGGEAI